MKNNSGVSKEITKSAISVSRVIEGDFQKEGTKTAELKQAVKTVTSYPEQAIVSSLQDNIFSAKDFAFESKEFTNVENRVAWIDVPAGLSETEVISKLEAFENASLYRILSNHPILSEQQEHAIDSADYPSATMEAFAASQAVRYPEDSDDAGKLALYEGKIQYRAIFFSSEGTEDQDLRTKEPTNQYLSAELEAEMTGVVHAISGQSL